MHVNARGGSSCSHLRSSAASESEPPSRTCGERSSMHSPIHIDLRRTTARTRSEMAAEACGVDQAGRRPPLISDIAGPIHRLQSRADHQLEDRQGARSDSPADAARPRRRSDRIGISQRKKLWPPMPAKGHSLRFRDVGPLRRFTPNIGHESGLSARQLRADAVEKLKKVVATKSRRAPVEPGNWHLNAL